MLDFVTFSLDDLNLNYIPLRLQRIFYKICLPECQLTSSRANCDPFAQCLSLFSHKIYEIQFFNRSVLRYIKQIAMKITARELAGFLNGELVGDPSIEVDRPSRIEEGTPGTLTFLANPKYESYAYQTNASVMLVSKDFEPKQSVKPTLIKVDNVYAAMAALVAQFDPNKRQVVGVSDNAVIHETAELGEHVAIGDFVVIGPNVKVGDHTELFPFVHLASDVAVGSNCSLRSGVKVMQDCIIGDNVMIHSNTVIGSDGFGFAKENGRFEKIKQVGNVIIENDVEIGANVTIDRASIGSTIIREGAKLDNLIQIAHNDEVGPHTAIAAQAGIAGSTKIGKDVLIGGQVGIIGHLKIGDGTQIQAQSGVTNNTEENARLYGSPALDYVHFLRSYASFRNLDEMRHQVKKMEDTIKELQKKLDELASG